jgi:hypothetical protein
MKVWNCADGRGAASVKMPSGVCAQPTRFFATPPEPMATRRVRGARLAQRQPARAGLDDERGARVGAGRSSEDDQHGAEHVVPTRSGPSPFRLLAMKGGDPPGGCPGDHPRDRPLVK